MTDKSEPKVTINGTEYNLADFSDDAKAQVVNLRAADAEIRHLNIRLALTQTAKNAYIKALEENLPKEIN